MINKLKELQKNNVTSRCGMKWLKDEDDKLLSEILEHKTYDDIALEHRRTITAIKSRVISNIIYPKYKENNTNIDELSLEYNIENELITKYINKMETNISIKNSIENNKEIINHSNESIQNRLKSIEDKLDYIINNMTK